MRPIAKCRKLLELERKERFLTSNATRKIHIVNFEPAVWLASCGIRLLSLWNRGMANAAQLQLTRCTMKFPNLPAEFNGYRILFMSDLHLEGLTTITDNIIRLAEAADYDICLLGGDYRFYDRGNPVPAMTYLDRLAPRLTARSRVIGILGNHDEYEIGLHLESYGVEMLANENRYIERNGARLHVCGVDDSNYYGAHDLAAALEAVPETDFKILLSHSPDIYREAAAAGFSVYLAGHTHGGQLCLPGGIPIITETSAPRRMVRGHWHYRKMQGFTCAGAGCSAIPIRFNCPPEVVLLTLCRDDGADA